MLETMSLVAGTMDRSPEARGRCPFYTRPSPNKIHTISTLLSSPAQPIHHHRYFKACKPSLLPHNRAPVTSRLCHLRLLFLRSSAGWDAYDSVGRRPNDYSSLLTSEGQASYRQARSTRGSEWLCSFLVTANHSRL